MMEGGNFIPGSEEKGQMGHSLVWCSQTSDCSGTCLSCGRHLIITKIIIRCFRQGGSC